VTVPVGRFKVTRRLLGPGCQPDEDFVHRAPVDLAETFE